MTYALEIDQVAVSVQPHFWKRRRTLLHGVSLTVDAGTVFGFLGPNGAGKTTTIKAVLGLLRPDRGHVRVLGGRIADAAIRRRVGFMPERAYYPEHLSGRELVTHHGVLAGFGWREARQRADAILERVGLTAAAGRKLGSFSKGMLQRVGFAQALVGDPDLVVLDEPMSGLDPIGRRDIRGLIEELAQRGKTVFFSTHILPDVEALCDQVAILVAGRVRRTGPLGEMLGGTVRAVDVTATGCDDDALEDARAASQHVNQSSDSYVFSVASQNDADALIDRLRAHGAHIVAVQTSRASLEAIFVQEVATDQPAMEKEA